jgi:hypothetical protein
MHNKSHPHKRRPIDPTRGSHPPLIPRGWPTLTLTQGITGTTSSRALDEITLSLIRTPSAAPRALSPTWVLTQIPHHYMKRPPHHLLDGRANATPSRRSYWTPSDASSGLHIAKRAPIRHTKMGHHRVTKLRHSHLRGHMLPSSGRGVGGNTSAQPPSLLCTSANTDCKPYLANSTMRSP